MKTSLENMVKVNLLYVINFYGTPPLCYFEKVFEKSDNVSLTILKLPAVRSKKNRLILEAFIKDSKGKIHEFNLNWLFPLPYFFIFFCQYIINIIIAVILLNRIKIKKFDLAIGESNFGGALCFVLKKIKKVKKTIYFNGDILPIKHSSTNCFFLPNNSSNKFIRFFAKEIDNLILGLQNLLRRISYHNDLIWYANKKIKIWDNNQSYNPKLFLIENPILIDYGQYKIYRKTKKNMSALGYIGRLDDYVGIDLIIESLTQISQKIPNIKLHIVGGNDASIVKFRILAKKFNVEDKVIFYGYVPSMAKVNKILSECALGLALYKPVSGNVSLIAQPAKPLEYIKVATPVLLTRGGPDIGLDIIKAGAGIESDFNPQNISKIISQILTDESNYQKLLNGVFDYAKKNHYSKKLDQIWKKIILLTQMSKQNENVTP